jgi:hypothetical protein
MTNLHSAITEHNMKEVDRLITKKKDLYQRNEQGLYPLQLAAREGLLSTVIAILEMGIKPDQGYDLINTINTLQQDLRSSLYFATTYGHFFVARVLFAYGADISKAKISISENPGLASALSCNEFLDSLTVDKNIICSLLYHGIKKSKTPHLDILLERIQTIPGEQTFTVILRLTEFALKMKQRDVALKLFALVDVADTDPHIPSAGYWDAINTQTISSDFCRTDADRALALFHLNKFASDGCYLNIFEKQTKQVQYLMTQIAPVTVRNALSGIPGLIYQAALKCDLLQLAVYFKNYPESFPAVFNYAFLESNFVAAYAIALNANQVVKESIMVTESPLLIQFAIITLDLNLLDLALHKVNKQQDKLFPFLENLWSRQGLMSMLVNLRLMKNAFVSKEDRELFDKLADPLLNHLSLPRMVARGINECLHIPLNNISIVNSPSLTTVTPYLSPEMNAAVLSVFAPKLRVLFYRFGMTFQNGEPFSLSPLENMDFEIYKIIISFLGVEEFHAMSVLSHYQLDRSARTKLNPLALPVFSLQKTMRVKAKRKRDLEKQIESLQFFREILISEDKKTIYRRHIIYLILTAATLVGTVELYINGLPILAVARGVRDSLRTQSFNNSGIMTTCSAISKDPKYGNGCDSITRLVEFCAALCSLIDTHEQAGYLAGMIIFTLLTLCCVSTWAGHVFCCETMLSPEAEKLLNQGWGDENYNMPFDFSIRDCSIEDITISVNETLRELELEYKNNDPTKTDRIVEIKDKIKETKQEVKEELNEHDDEKEAMYLALDQIDEDEDEDEAIQSNDIKPPSVSYLGLWSMKRKNSRELLTMQASSKDSKHDYKNESELDENTHLMGWLPSF